MGEDLLAGVVAGGRFDPHRPPIRPPTPGARVGRVEVDTVVEDGVDGAVEQLRPPLAVDTGARSDGVAEVLDDVEAMPRRPPLTDRRHHLADRDPLLLDRRRLRRVADRRFENVRGDADSGGLGAPQRAQIGRCGAGLVAAGVLGGTGGRSPRVPWCVGSRPSRARNSASIVCIAASTCAARFENASNTSAGKPAMSACPFTMSDPRRHRTGT